MSNPELPNSEEPQAAVPPVPPAAEQAGSHEPPAYDAMPQAHMPQNAHLGDAGYPPPEGFSGLTGGTAPGYPTPGEYPANQGYPAAAYPAAPGYAPAPASPKGRTLSIVGLVLAFLAAPVGLILSIIAAVQLAKSRGPKGLAIAGIIVGAILTILAVIGIILMVSVFSHIFEVCAANGPGVWRIDGVTYTCE